MNKNFHKVEAEFPLSEYLDRERKLQAGMNAQGIGAVVITSPASFRYFTGFATEFWESPTRPWFLVIPSDRHSIAVIPEIGVVGMELTWVSEIHSWSAPQPEDDGISLLAGILKRSVKQGQQIGFEMGRETVLRMPITDFNSLCVCLAPSVTIDASALIWSVRMEKSAGEIAYMRSICAIADQAFAEMEKKLCIGDTEYSAAQKMRVSLLTLGADAVPFVAACSGDGGYRQIIVGSTQAVLDSGKVLFIDTGATKKGYFCDFDRNFAFAEISRQAANAYAVLWNATDVALEAARPGLRACDLWQVMDIVLQEHGYSNSSTGRYGHGLGLQLTEPPSLRAGDETILKPGMVITIEPGLEYAPGKMLVMEENIVLTRDGIELLSKRAPERMPVITR